MKQHTYKEWQKLGYHIVKGQKACGRNEKNECVFNETQVKVNELPKYITNPNAYDDTYAEQDSYYENHQDDGIGMSIGDTQG